MKIVTFQRRSRSTRGGLLLEGNRVLDLGRAYERLLEDRQPASDDTAAIVDSLRGLSSSILEILKGGDDPLLNCFELERRANEGRLEEYLYPLGDTPLVAPIPEPPLLLQFSNYEDSARREADWVGAPKLPPSWNRYPVHAFSNPFNVQGPGSAVVFPEGETRMDWELEIGAVLVEDVQDATLEDAEDAILGYTMVLSWVARDLQLLLHPAGLGSSKAKAIGCAMGPVIVTKDEVPNPWDLPFQVRQNGVERASGTSVGNHFSFAEMIVFASSGTRLPAGSVLCSGALPGASGMAAGHFLTLGDTVEAEVEGIGFLSAKVYPRQHSNEYRPRS